MGFDGRAEHSTACGSIVASCWRFLFRRGYLTALYVHDGVLLILPGERKGRTRANDQADDTVDNY